MHCQIEDNGLNPHVTDVVNLDTMPHNVQDDTTNEYQLLNITSAGKATPWNVSVDIEGSQS